MRCVLFSDQDNNPQVTEHVISHTKLVRKGKQGKMYNWKYKVV